MSSANKDDRPEQPDAQLLVPSGSSPGTPTTDNRKVEVLSGYSRSGVLSPSFPEADLDIQPPKFYTAEHRSAYPPGTGPTWRKFTPQELREDGTRDKTGSTVPAWSASVFSGGTGSVNKTGARSIPTDVGPAGTTFSFDPKSATSTGSLGSSFADNTTTDK